MRTAAEPNSKETRGTFWSWKWRNQERGCQNLCLQVARLARGRTEGCRGHVGWLSQAGASMWLEPGWGQVKGWDCEGWDQLSAAGLAASSLISSQGCSAAQQHPVAIGTDTAPGHSALSHRHFGVEMPTDTKGIFPSRSHPFPWRGQRSSHKQHPECLTPMPSLCIGSNCFLSIFYSLLHLRPGV